MFGVPTSVRNPCIIGRTSVEGVKQDVGERSERNARDAHSLEGEAATSVREADERSLEQRPCRRPPAPPDRAIGGGREARVLDSRLADPREGQMPRRLQE